MCCRPSTSPRWRTCSFAVKTKIVQILFIFLCTVLAAAAQDMLPSFGGTKPPLLLALTLYWAFSESTGSVRDRASGKRRTFAVRWIFAAFVTGAFEDALSEFPFGCATGYYLLAGAAARFIRPFVHALSPMTLGLVALMVAAPFHETWLSVWGVTGSTPAALVRFFASALPAAPTGVLVFAILPLGEQFAGFHGPKLEGRAI